MIKVTINKFSIATQIALLFHIAGFVGMLTSKSAWFVKNTPLNLLVMFSLIIWTQPGKNKSFYYFLLAAFAVGMITEIIGVNTGLLFGSYKYGEILGPKILSVPCLIGINWATLMYCCGMAVENFQSWVYSKTPGSEELFSRKIKIATIVIDGAILATVFDLILEPVAVRLDYWFWIGDGRIPFLNYLCWFFISMLVLIVFKLLRFRKQNQFALHLLIIQMLFFSALRTFL